MLELLKRMTRPMRKLSAPDVHLEKGFHSCFGGLWPDRLDAEDVLLKKKAAGKIDDEMEERLRFWMDNGYVIIPHAVPHEYIDALYEDIDRAWVEQDDRFLVQTGHGDYIPLSQAEREKTLIKLLDVYVYSEAGRKVAFADPITKFLANIFEDDVLAFQNLTFEVGSTQAIHQDTAYVVVNKPMSLAASWIALEDIQEGSGELMYYPGSHRYPDFMFGEKYKHWDIARDGNEAHQVFLKHLHERANERGLKIEKFRPKKGDALIWHADLAHGGSPITKEKVTRKSYVTHYCPNACDPHYFSYLPKRKTRVPYGKHCFYSSSHYNV